MYSHSSILPSLKLSINILSMMLDHISSLVMKTIVLSLKINALEFIKNNSSTPINSQLWSGNSRLVSLMLWNLFKMQNLSIGIAFINCHQKKDWNISTIKKISQLYSRNYLTIFMIRSNWWRTTRNTFEFGEVQSFQTRL